MVSVVFLPKADLRGRFVGYISWWFHPGKRTDVQSHIWKAYLCPYVFMPLMYILTSGIRMSSRNFRCFLPSTLEDWVAAPIGSIFAHRNFCISITFLLFNVSVGVGFFLEGSQKVLRV